VSHNRLNRRARVAIQIENEIRSNIRRKPQLRTPAPEKTKRTHAFLADSTPIVAHSHGESPKIPKPVSMVSSQTSGYVHEKGRQPRCQRSSTGNSHHTKAIVNQQRCARSSAG
jgi:hypothetical protein